MNCSEDRSVLRHMVCGVFVSAPVVEKKHSNNNRTLTTCT